MPQTSVTLYVRVWIETLLFVAASLKSAKVTLYVRVWIET